MIGFEDFENFSASAWLDQGMSVKPKTRKARRSAMRRDAIWTSQLALAISIMTTSTDLIVSAPPDVIRGLNVSRTGDLVRGNAHIQGSQALGNTVSRIVSEASKLIKALNFIPINPAHDAIVDQLINERLAGATRRLISPRR